MRLKDKAFLCAVIYGVQFVPKDVASWMVCAFAVIGVAATLYEAKE